MSPGDGTWIRSVAFSPNGSTLATGGGDRTIRLWDLRDPEAPPEIVGRHEDVVRRVRFSPEGRRLASASADRDIRLWDLVDRTAPPAVLSGHDDSVWTLAFSPDGKIPASAGADRKILLWEMTHPLMQMTTRGLIEAVCEKAWRNLTLDEWQQFVGEDIPYERTCPKLPVHPSLIETAEKMAFDNFLTGLELAAESQGKG